MITAELLNSKLLINVEEDIEEVYSQYYYGKKTDQGLELSFTEGMHLFDRDLAEISVEGENPGREELYREFVERDEEFELKYRVYSDLRERGFIVKSGFKFGTHFRVYPRGANPYTDEKGKKDHTKWVVQAVRESESRDMEEISRAVRLAHNIRARMLWGVVDSEGDVTYLEIKHVKP